MRQNEYFFKIVHDYEIWNDHAYSFSSSNDVNNSNIFCDLEEKEIICDDPFDIDDIKALHPMVMIISSSHVINVKLDMS